MSELPDSWEIAPLGALLSGITGGGTPSKANAENFRGLIPFMTVKDMHARFIEDTQDHITEQALEESASTLIPADTLIVASRMSLGKIARPKVPVAINQDLKALFLHQDINKTYVEYLWKASETRIREMGTGTTVKGIRLEDIRGLPVPVAPSSEQTRIADQLGILLARINTCNDHLDAIRGIVKRFRQSVLDAALTGTLLDDDRFDTASVERKTTKISEVASVGTGSTPLRSNENFYAESGTPWVTSAATGQPLIASADQFVTQAAIAAHRLKIYPKGTLLVAMYGEGKTRGQVSELAIDATINQACAAISVNEERASRKYVKLALAANYLAMRELAEGGNQPNLNLSKIKDFEIPLLSLEQQAEVVSRVEALLTFSDRIESRCSAMRAHAMRLAPQVLTKAFRGELVAQDSKDEPASVLLHRLAARQPIKAAGPRGRPRTQPQVQVHPVLKPTDWATLPEGEWAAPADPQGQLTTVCLTAVLRAWGQPMPESEARLAALLCQQPRLFSVVLPVAQARQWYRLVGDDAKPLPANVPRIQPATNSHWGQAIQRMRARGDLIEAGSGDVTWALGPGAVGIDTAGWPDGRASVIVAHLRAHGIESILPSMNSAEQDLVNARAA